MFSNQSVSRKTCVVTILALCWCGGVALALSQASPHLLITEVSLHYPEFVEIYNPTDQEMSLSGFRFCYYPTNRVSWEEPWRSRQFPSEASISPHGYFLLTLGDDETGRSLLTDWNVYLGMTLNGDGGAVAILNGALGNRVIVDAVGWGTSHLSVGCAALEAPESMALARILGTNEGTPFQNTGDNATDFHHSPPSPSSTRSGVVIIPNEPQMMNRETGALEFSLCNASPDTHLFTINIESEIGYTAIPQPTTLSLAPGEWGRVSIHLVTYDYYVIDLETTGLDPNKCSIIEAAWVYVCGGEVVQSDSSLIFSEEELSSYVRGLTGITSEMLVTAPRLELVIPPMLARLEGEAVLSYSRNAFDRRFLEEAATSLGLDMPTIQWIDVFSLAKEAMPDLVSHSLRAVAESLGIEGSHHRALSDSIMTNLVFQEAVQQLGSRLHVEIRTEEMELPVGVLVLLIAPF